MSVDDCGSSTPSQPDAGRQVLVRPRRDVAQSLFPDIVPHRPVGPIPASVHDGNNAELVRKIAGLYLGGSVMDVTYGTGGWWTELRPEGLIAHDLHTLDGVDFCHLPEADRSIDAVCFDPPYIPQGGYETSTARTFADRFGLTSRSRSSLWDLIELGLVECARVARRWVLVKCMDFTNGGMFHLGHVEVIRMGEEHGLYVHDLLIHKGGSGPGGHNIFVPIRARRHHSYLVIFGHEADKWTNQQTEPPTEPAASGPKEDVGHG